jgi:hypothetical protein
MIHYNANVLCYSKEIIGVTPVIIGIYQEAPLKVGASWLEHKS